jgi:hypothetical protein
LVAFLLSLPRLVGSNFVIVFLDVLVVCKRKVDRFDSAYLAQWRAYYRNTVERYVAGATSWTEAHNALASLGFRDGALKVELLELDKARAKQGLAGPGART